MAGNGPAAPTAASFLRSLEAEEGALSVPFHTCRIRLRVEPGVQEMWEEAVGRCRSAHGTDRQEWEVLAIALEEFWKEWDNAETRRQRRTNPTLERDGWRCTAPACRSVGTGRLHEHHVRLRSAGGAEMDPSNLSTQCAGHHIGLLHQGKMRCRGRAPGELVWETGVQKGREPYLVYLGETRIRGGGHVRE